MQGPVQSFPLTHRHGPELRWGQSNIPQAGVLRFVAILTYAEPCEVPAGVAGPMNQTIVHDASAQHTCVSPRHAVFGFCLKKCLAQRDLHIHHSQGLICFTYGGSKVCPAF